MTIKQEFFKRDLKENRVIHVEKEHINAEFKISPNGERVAYILHCNVPPYVTDGSSPCASSGYYVSDAYVGAGPYRQITIPIFSPDSRRLAYIAQLENKWFAFIDGRREEPYEAIATIGPIFSPDSKRVAYVACDNGHWFVVADGRREENSYDGIGESSPVFSPNSQRMAYMAQSGQNKFVVVDGIKQKYYDVIKKNCPIFNSQNRLVYAAKMNSKWCMVIDDQEGMQWDSVGYPIFSPDGNHVAHIATQGDKQFVVIDGKKDSEFDAIGNNSLAFSPDSSQIIYTALLANKWHVLINGKEELQHEGSGVGGCVFSPNSKRLAYIVGANKQQFVVIDGQIGKRFDGIGRCPVFSPNSERVAYIAQAGSKQYIVIDGIEEGRYNGIAKPIFSPDSKYLAYGVMQGKTLLFLTFGKKWFIVINGQEGKSYDTIQAGDVIFKDSNNFSYIAQIDDDIFLVNETIITE